MTGPAAPRPRRSPRGAAGFVAVVVALTAAGLAAAGVLGAVRPGAGGPAAPSATADVRAVPGPAAPAVPTGPPVPVVLATPPPVATAAPTAPVRLAVPGRGIEVPVDPVGVDAEGRMEVPPLAERGGWYRFGADPGDAAGTTVVAAHVDSVASGGTGPFARLVEVRAGDRVEVTLADGTVRGYTVQEVTPVPKTEVSWPDVFTRDGPARLALVTCGGSFDRAARSYSDNVLVLATPAGA